MGLGEESGNGVPETLTDKEKFKEVYEKINESSNSTSSFFLFL